MTEDTLKVRTDIKVVKSRDLFELMSKVYAITADEARDAVLGDAGQYTYYVGRAEDIPTPAWEDDFPEDWSKVSYESVNLSAVLRDFLKRGLVEAGEYIVLHSW